MDPVTPRVDPAAVHYDPESVVVCEGRPVHLEALKPDGWVWVDSFGQQWPGTFSLSVNYCKSKARRLEARPGRPMPCRIVLCAEEGR